MWHSHLVPVCPAVSVPSSCCHLEVAGSPVLHFQEGSSVSHLSTHSVHLALTAPLPVRFCQCGSLQNEEHSECKRDEREQESATAVSTPLLLSRQHIFVCVSANQFTLYVSELLMRSAGFAIRALVSLSGLRYHRSPFWMQSLFIICIANIFPSSISGPSALHIVSSVEYIL